MNVVWGRVPVCIAGAALAGIVAGCAGGSGSTGSGPGASSSAAAVAPPSGSTPRATATATASASVAAIHRTSAASPAPSASTPPAPRTCTAADLVVVGDDRVRSQDGRLDDWVNRISLRNGGRSTCRLDGWAGLTFVGDAAIYVCASPGEHGPQCGSHPDTTSVRAVQVARSGVAAPPDVVLTPGARTVFGVLWTLDLGDSCTGSEPSVDPYGVRIRVPGDSRPLALVVFGDGDLMELCDSEVRVTAFGTAG